MPLFGAAVTVGVALITQMGEQVDYLRFMPERTAKNGKRWLAAVLIGGPGWVVLGVIKMLGGALLAYLVISNSVPSDRDAKKMRDERPFLFTNMKTGLGLNQIISFIETQGLLK